MMNRSLFVMATAVVLIAASFAQANLIVEVRAVSSNLAGNSTPDVIITNDGKSVLLAGSSSMVAFNVYAKVTDSTPPDSTATSSFTSAMGSILSTKDLVTGAVRGNIELPWLIDPYATTGTAGKGTLSDLNLDGDMDVGQNTNTSASGWVNPRAATPIPLVQFDAETLVASFLYDVTAAHAGTDTLLNWRIRANAAGGLWNEDGGIKTPTPSTAPTNYGAGADVHLNVVPEPSTLILLGMGCLALLAYRRRK